MIAPHGRRIISQITSNMTWHHSVSVVQVKMNESDSSKDHAVRFMPANLKTSIRRTSFTNLTAIGQRKANGHTNSGTTSAYSVLQLAALCHPSQCGPSPTATCKGMAMLSSRQVITN